MDVRPKIEPVRVRKVLSVTFNNDKTCFAIGLEEGFMVLRTQEGTVMLKKNLLKGIGLAQMRGNSNIIALVGGGQKPKFAANKVVLWDESKQQGGSTITTRKAIRAVKVSAHRVIVAMLNSIQIFNLHTGDLMNEYETADNANGLLCVSSKQVAFPGRTPGQFQVVEVDTGDVTMIPAHGGPLRAMAFSSDGDLLTTASDKGTIIRVFSTSNFAMVCELRRGMDPAIIYDLCFSPSGNLLACTSDKGTLHIFDVSHPNKKPTNPITAPNVPGVVVGGSSGGGGGGSGSSSRPGSSSSTGGGGGGGGGGGKTKWGWLSQVPGLPRAFSDTYSFTSIPFSTGDETMGGWEEPSSLAPLGTTKPQKGLIGWYEEESLVVIGAGVDARWEKYQMGRDDNDKRFIGRVGFKRYYNEH